MCHILTNRVGGNSSSMHFHFIYNLGELCGKKNNKINYLEFHKVRHVHILIDVYVTKTIRITLQIILSFRQPWFSLLIVIVYEFGLSPVKKNHWKSSREKINSRIRDDWGRTPDIFFIQGNFHRLFFHKRIFSDFFTKGKSNWKPLFITFSPVEDHWIYKFKIAIF